MKGIITAVWLAAASAGVLAQSQGGQAKPALKLTGCLQPAQNGQNAFQLIVPGEKAPGSTAEPSVTTTYALTPTGDVDLKTHVNEMVELSGSELPAPRAEATVADSSRGQAASQPTGTAGRADASKGAKTTPTPIVETTAKAQIVAKAMTVDAVKTVATKCDLVK